MICLKLLFFTHTLALRRRSILIILWIFWSLMQCDGQQNDDDVASIVYRLIHTCLKWRNGNRIPFISGIHGPRGLFELLTFHRWAISYECSSHCCIQFTRLLYSGNSTYYILQCPLKRTKGINEEMFTLNVISNRNRSKCIFWLSINRVSNTWIKNALNFMYDHMTIRVKSSIIILTILASHFISSTL